MKVFRGLSCPYSYRRQVNGPLLPESWRRVREKMKTSKKFVLLALLSLFLLSLAWQAVAQVTDTPTPSRLDLTPTPVPVAGFSSNVTTGTVPLMVQFTDESTGSPTGWQWSWGDLSANDTGPNPVHVFNLAGHYTVTLTVTNPGGSNTTQKINYINVTAGADPDSDALLRLRRLSLRRRRNRVRRPGRRPRRGSPPRPRRRLRPS